MDMVSGMIYIYIWFLWSKITAVYIFSINIMTCKVARNGIITHI